MLSTVETEDRFEIQSQLPAGQRVLLFCLALLPLLAPYELLIQPTWQHYFNIVFVIAAIISLGALSISAALVWSAVAGMNTRLWLDRATGTLSYTITAPVLRQRSRHFPLEALDEFQIETQDWGEGPDSYALTALLNDGQRLKCGSTYSGEAVQAIVERATAFLSA
jgi:hypothetical protein